MFLRIPVRRTDLEDKINNAFVAAEVDFDTILNSIWKDEKIRGMSKQYSKLQYQLLPIYLLILVYLYIQDVGDITWEEVSNKYGLDKISYALSCQDIDFDKYLKAFSYPFADYAMEGIEGEFIEGGMAIETGTPIIDQEAFIDFAEIVKREDKCFNILCGEKYQVTPGFESRFIVTGLGGEIITNEEENIVA